MFQVAIVDIDTGVVVTTANTGQQASRLAGQQVEGEGEIEIRFAHLPLPVQVRNQARMHRMNDNPPYRDTAHAMTHWLETCTAVGVRLEVDDRLGVVAPLGLDDLLGLVFQPSDAGRRHYAAYRHRIDSKPWRAQWPGATFIA